MQRECGVREGCLQMSIVANSGSMGNSATISVEVSASETLARFYV